MYNKVCKQDNEDKQYIVGQVVGPGGDRYVVEGMVGLVMRVYRGASRMGGGGGGRGGGSWKSGTSIPLFLWGRDPLT